MAEERKATPEMYARVFQGHAEGVIILEDLVYRFFDREVFVAGAQDGERATMIRIGERRAVGFILKQIGQVREGDPNVEA